MSNLRGFIQGGVLAVGSRECWIFFDWWARFVPLLVSLRYWCSCKLFLFFVEVDTKVLLVSYINCTINTDSKKLGVCAVRTSVEKGWHWKSNPFCVPQCGLCDILWAVCQCWVGVIGEAERYFNNGQRSCKSEVEPCDTADNVSIRDLATSLSLKIFDSLLEAVLA